jgi:hypothetical protein
LHLAPPNHECPNSAHFYGASRAGGGAVHSIKTRRLFRSSYVSFAPVADMTAPSQEPHERPDEHLSTVFAREEVADSLLRWDLGVRGTPGWE